MLESRGRRALGRAGRRGAARRTTSCVHRPTGRTLGYGEVARDAAALPVPAGADLQLKKPAEFRYIGKGKTPIVDGFDMTTGRAIYGMDVVLPDMLFAVVARAPVYGGTLRGFDAAEAMKVPGVREGGRDQGHADSRAPSSRWPAWR